MLRCIAKCRRVRTHWSPESWGYYCTRFCSLKQVLHGSIVKLLLGSAALVRYHEWKDLSCAPAWHLGPHRNENSQCKQSRPSIFQLPPDYRRTVSISILSEKAGAVRTKSKARHSISTAGLTTSATIIFLKTSAFPLLPTCAQREPHPTCHPQAACSSHQTLGFLCWLLSRHHKPP